MVRARLGVHLGDQRAGGVEVEQVARLGGSRHRLRHPMCRKDHGCTGFWDLVQLLHKNGAFGLQVLDHVAVVDDLVAHIDGGAEPLQRQLDDLDGAVDTGTEAARRGQEDLQRRTGTLGGRGRVGHEASDLFAIGSRSACLAPGAVRCTVRITGRGPRERQRGSMG